MIKYALIALACATGLSSAAMADDDIAVSASDGLTWTASVNLADLNLTERRDRVALRIRLKQAVRAVCDTDAACTYTAERNAARQASNVIASANGWVSAAAPARIMVSGVH